MNYREIVNVIRFVELSHGQRTSDKHRNDKITSINLSFYSRFVRHRALLICRIELLLSSNPAIFPSLFPSSNNQQRISPHSYIKILILKTKKYVYLYKQRFSILQKEQYRFQHPDCSNLFPINIIEIRSHCLLKETKEEEKKSEIKTFSYILLKISFDTFILNIFIVLQAILN